MVANPTNVIFVPKTINCICVKNFKLKIVILGENTCWITRFVSTAWGVNLSARSCKTPIRCRICRRHHNTLLHPKTTSKENLTAAVVTENSGEEQVDELVEEPVEEIQANTASVRNKAVLLATALVNAEAKNGTYQTVRALLDQGSQASFVTESVVQLFKLKKTPA